MEKNVYQLWLKQRQQLVPENQDCSFGFSQAAEKKTNARLFFGTLTLLISLSLFFCQSYAYAQDATVNIDRNAAIRTIPDELYGWNSTIWDGKQNGNNASYNNLLINGGFKAMRWCGGSWGDAVKWDDVPCKAPWAVTYAQSRALFNRLGIKFMPIVNFSGWWCETQHSHAEATALAASWVREGALGAKYWEVGNEIMGGWEQGHTYGADYGNRFADFYKAMKAVNPNIKVIAVGSQHDRNDPFNPGTGVWTREVLKAAKAKGVVPDGFQIHNYPGGSNQQLLHGDLDAIGQWTTNLNNMIAQETGAGQLDYCMTEFGASGNERWIKFIGGQLVLQYIMEMAKYKWSASNVFGEIYNTSNFRAAPVWYIYAFLNGKFGKNMVNANSTNGDVRSYASVTSDNALTVFVCNNATSSKTVKLNLANFSPASNGQIWVIEGANGGGEEAYDVSINGTVHPDESAVRTMTGTTIATSNGFSITMPKSSIALIRIPMGSGCTPTAITPYIKINGAAWQQASSGSLNTGGRVIFGPQAFSGGSWSWTGPNGFTATTREVNITNIQPRQRGNYVARFKNTAGCESAQTFTVTVNGASANGLASEMDLDEGGLKAYPNPSKGSFSVEFPNVPGDVSIKVYDSKGALVLEKKATDGKSDINEQLQSGIYTIKVSNGKILSQRKIVIN